MHKAFETRKTTRDPGEGVVNKMNIMFINGKNELGI